MNKYMKHTFVKAAAALLLTSGLLTSSKAGAQRIHAFLSSGVTVSQIEGDALKGFDKFGYTGGVGALASIGGNWGVSVEAIFSQRGSRNTKSGEAYIIDLTLPYVDIPLMLHYQDIYGGMLFGLGLSYGRLVGQPHSVMMYNPEYFVPDTSNFSFLPSDLAFVIDARFTIWRGLQFDLRYQYSLMAVKRDWLFHEKVQGRWTEFYNDCYNSTVSMRLIYQF